MALSTSSSFFYISFSGSVLPLETTTYKPADHKVVVTAMKKLCKWFIRNHHERNHKPTSPSWVPNCCILVLMEKASRHRVIAYSTSYEHIKADVKLVICHPPVGTTIKSVVGQFCNSVSAAASKDGVRGNTSESHGYQPTPLSFPIW